MPAKLHLVRGRARDKEELWVEREEIARFPAHEEVWEVSCEPDRVDPPRPKLTDTRRAS